MERTYKTIGEESEEHKYHNICDQCFRDAIFIGEIFPNYDLMYVNGIFCLVTGNGHPPNDFEIIFPWKPIPDPDPTITTPESDVENFKKSTDWIDSVGDWWENFQLSPTTGHFLVDSATKIGWDWGETTEHKLFSFWLVDQAGKMIEEFEKKHNVVLEYKEDGMDDHMAGCICGHLKKLHDKNGKCEKCKYCNEYRKKLTNLKIMNDFIKEYPHDPLLISVGDGGYKIVIYVHKKNHNYKFPNEFKGIPVYVKYVGILQM